MIAMFAFSFENEVFISNFIAAGQVDLRNRNLFQTNNFLTILTIEVGVFVLVVMTIITKI
jgi:hypothetical protein